MTSAEIVKLIEWGKTSYGLPEAVTVVGTYRIVESFSGGWSVSRGQTTLRTNDGRTNFATQDDAKAAAQTDYEQRVLSCLQQEGK